MAEQKKNRFGNLLQKAQGKFDIAGVPVGDIVSTISGVIKRSPSVRAWASDKRAEKRRLRARGLSGSDLRQALRTWTANNPRPQGSEPYNPSDLGTSNQMNGGAQANISSAGTFAGGSYSPPVKSGFNPLWLLLLATPFIFPKQFKGIRKSLKI